MLLSLKNFVFRVLPDEKVPGSGEKDRMLQEKEEELRRMQEMLAKMQAQMQQHMP